MPSDNTLHLYLHLDPALERKLFRFLGTLVNNEEKIMAKIDDLVTDVASETTLEGSVETLLTGLAAQVAALQSGDPATQAKIDALHTQLTSNITALQAAVTANTPVPPAPSA